MSAGFGFTNTGDSKKYAIKVSDSLDYEISFWWKQPTREATFELSVKGFDCDLNKEIKLIDVRSGAFNTVLVPGNLRICSLENKWNFFHGVIYNKDFKVHSSQQAITSHAKGTNLIMRNGIQKLFVNLICVRNCMLVWDFKVKPLGTQFSTGFIQSNGMIEVWRKNNKKDLSVEQIDTIAQQFLLPYDVPTSVINL